MFGKQRSDVAFSKRLEWEWRSPPPMPRVRSVTPVFQTLQVSPETLAQCTGRQPGTRRGQSERRGAAPAAAQVSLRRGSNGQEERPRTNERATTYQVYEHNRNVAVQLRVLLHVCAAQSQGSERDQSVSMLAICGGASNEAGARGCAEIRWPSSEFPADSPTKDVIQ